MELSSIVEQLISRKAEGVYWDFKSVHHAERADLVHDVLALANADHQGDRYLIFGVDESAGYQIGSVRNDPNRRSQADIASLFRDNASKFFQSRYPAFYLREISVDSEAVDVLVISDTSQKPFHLVANFRKLPRNCVYTRVCDTNTPYSQSAAPHEIERMWRNRFGIDKIPSERLIGLLGHPEDWEPLRDDPTSARYFCSRFPEFTIRAAGSTFGLGSSQEWTRGEVVRDSNHAGFFDLHFHQTLLERVHYVSFDDHKKSMVAPDWEPRHGGRFYFYESSTLQFAVQSFFATKHGRDDSRRLMIGGDGKYSTRARDYWPNFMAIPVLGSGELADFLGGGRESSESEVITDPKEQYQVFLRNQLEFEQFRRSRLQN